MVAMIPDPLYLATLDPGTAAKLAAFRADCDRWLNHRANDPRPCPSCGAGGPTLGTDLPCECPPPAEEPDIDESQDVGMYQRFDPEEEEPALSYESYIDWRDAFGRDAGSDAAEREYRAHVASFAHRLLELETPADVACQAEARFGLETARDLLDGLYMTGFDAEVRATVRAHIERAITVLP